MVGLLDVVKTDIHRKDVLDVVKYHHEKTVKEEMMKKKYREKNCPHCVMRREEESPSRLPAACWCWCASLMVGINPLLGRGRQTELDIFRRSYC